MKTAMQVLGLLRVAKKRKAGGLDDRSDFLRLFFSSLGGGPGRIPARYLYELESKLLKRGALYRGLYRDYYRVIEGEFRLQLICFDVRKATVGIHEVTVDIEKQLLVLVQLHDLLVVSRE